LKKKSIKEDFLMKKILVVLALLLACGMAFSVTGSVYLRLDQSGSIHDTEWGTLDDMSYGGRRGSGVDINFDNFGVSYKLRGPITLGGTNATGSVTLTNFSAYSGIIASSAGLPSAGPLSGEYVGTGIWAAYNSSIGVGKLQATSPGYLQFTGIKLGNATLNIGGSWWHFDESQASLSTNANGTTNLQVASGSGAGYNHFAFNSYFSIPVSDTVKIQNVGWDQMQIDFGFGSATINGVSTKAATSGSTNWSVTTNYDNVGGSITTNGFYLTAGTAGGTTATTNTGSSSVFRIYLPFYIDITMDKLSLELYPKFVFGNSADTWNSIGSTNTLNFGEAYVSGMVRIGYSINDNWAFYGDIGLVMWNRNTTLILTTSTNTEANNILEAPIRAGFTFKPAPWFTLNLGLGYIAELSTSDTLIQGSSTNVINYSGGLAGHYNVQDEQEHAYNHPFINFGSTSKFAEDWSIGVTEVVLLNAGGGAFGNIGYYNNVTSPQQGLVSVNQIFHFDNVWNFDSGGALCWLQYSKDNVTFKGTFGNGAGLLGLFSQMDISLNF
jgi:hypothetical protein